MILPKSSDAFPSVSAAAYKLEYAPFLLVNSSPLYITILSYLTMNEPTPTKYDDEEDMDPGVSDDPVTCCD